MLDLSSLVAGPEFNNAIAKRFELLIERVRRDSHHHRMKHRETTDLRVRNDSCPPNINHQLLICVVTHHRGVVINVQPPFLVLSNSFPDYVDSSAAPVIEIEGLMLVSFPSLRSHAFRSFGVCQSGHHVVGVEYSEMVILLQLSHVQSE